MPRKATHKVGPKSTDSAIGNVACRILNVTSQGSDFVAELLFTDPKRDYQIIRVTLPGPIQPDNRIGRLLQAAGLEITPGERVDIDQGVGKDIRVRLMHINGQVEPIDFSPNKEPPLSKPQEP